MKEIFSLILKICSPATIMVIITICFTWLDSDTEQSFEYFKQENFNYLILEKCQTPKACSFNHVIVLNLETNKKRDYYLKYNRINGLDDFYDYLQKGDTIFKEINSPIIIIVRGQGLKKEFQGTVIKNNFEIDVVSVIMEWIFFFFPTATIILLIISIERDTKRYK